MSRESRGTRSCASAGVNPRKCMRCGKCSGTCPSYDEMEYHPHQFVYMVEKGEIEPLMPSPIAVSVPVLLRLRGALPARTWSRAKLVEARPPGGHPPAGRPTT